MSMHLFRVGGAKRTGEAPTLTGENTANHLAQKPEYTQMQI